MPALPLTRELINYAALISDFLPLGTNSHWNLSPIIIIIAFDTEAQETDHVNKELKLKGGEGKKNEPYSSFLSNPFICLAGCKVCAVVWGERRKNATHGEAEVAPRPRRSHIQKNRWLEEDLANKEEKTRDFLLFHPRLDYFNASRSLGG